MPDSPSEVPPPPPSAEVAIVLPGGGARAAYQLGLLRFLARAAPEYRFPIVTGVSAGAINAMYLAAHPEGLAAAVAGLSEVWRDLELRDVFQTNGIPLGRNAVRWGLRLFSGGARLAPEVRGLVDTRPLDRLLRRTLATIDGEITGIARNLEAGHLRAAALTTLNYTTGTTVTWVDGREIETWTRPGRRSAQVRLTVDHVLASASLPLLFPAVRLADGWHGDGGVRLAAPLSPAVHLGARRILAVSTRYQRPAEEQEISPNRYPPPAQILGKLLNAIFLDVIDQDAERLERINHLLRQVPPERRGGMREIDCVVLRPSVDLGRLAGEYEAGLPRGFRFLTRGLGTRETASADFLSLLMFHPDYIQRLTAIGEADAEARGEEIRRLVLGEG
jgi:NTE family protein